MNVLHRFRLTFAVAFLTCSVPLALLSHAVESQEPSGVKRALLIGINKYKSVPKLQGSLNDIETMRQILIKENLHFASVTRYCLTNCNTSTACSRLTEGKSLRNSSSV